MPNYIYSDEDNAAMTDERWEAERERSAQRMDERWAEKRQREKDKAERKRWNAIDGVADVLGLTGDCVKCDWFIDLAEGFLDGDDQISSEQLDYLKHQCSLCGGMGTGKPKDEQHEKWVENSWDDIIQWVELNGLKFHCCWCPNVFRIYGQYKDPDDEWKAIENACCNCKHFGED